MQRVDAVEMEPAVMEMVRRSALGNGDPIHNPKVHIRFGDGREHLLTTRSRYDVITSEPSNPYRAGVASLYSREFYRAAAARLGENGMFLQWLQAYDITPTTLKTVYATMCAVFPNVETWTTLPGDLLLVGSMKPVAHDVPSLRRRLTEEPFRSGFVDAWRVNDLEGVVARHIGNNAMSLQLARGATLNTDDRTILEYAFARNLGTDAQVMLDDLYKLGFSSGAGADWTGGALDVHRIVPERATSLVLKQGYPPLPPNDSPYKSRILLMWYYLRPDYEQAVNYVKLDQVNPNDLTEVAIVADVLAEAGDPAARQAIEWLRVNNPIEADFVLARYLARTGDVAGATDAYERACLDYRRDPWVWPLLAARTLTVAQDIARNDASKEYSERLYRALDEPFAGRAANYRRLIVQLNVAGRLDDGVPGKRMRKVIDALGQPYRWEQDLLEARAACFRNAHDPREAHARRELERYRRNESPGLIEGNL